MGFLSRPIAFLLAGNMTVAYLTADRPALLGVFHDLDTFLKADPFWFFFVSSRLDTRGDSIPHPLRAVRRSGL